MAFLYGLVALALVLFLLRRLSSANPANVAQIVRRVGGGLALILGIILTLRGGGAIGAPVAAFGAMLLGLNQIPGFPYSAGQGGPAGRQSGPQGSSQQSQVRTGWLDMRLDHDSGHMDGIVLQGGSQGKLLSELNIADVVTLMHTCQGDDVQSAQLLEAYLDWREPDWRSRFAGAQEDNSDTGQGSATMSRDEAFDVLGLTPGASVEDIRKAHRNLMKHVHPDHGGSSYLAAKINAAKEILLRR